MPVTISLGGKRTLKVGKTTANVTVSGDGSGISDVTIATTPDTTDVPGGGASYPVVGQFTDWQISFDVLANASTYPVFEDAHGKVRAFALALPDSLGTYTGKAVCAVQKVSNPNSGMQRYRVVMYCDGAPTVT